MVVMADSKIKDSLMKLLLSSGPSSSLGSHGTPTSSIASPQSDQGEDSCPLLSSYLHQINASGQNEISQPWEKVHFDHNYARSGSDSTYHSHVRPTKTLFMTKTTSPLTGNDDFIDITTEVYYPTPPYDINKAHQAMEECEKYINETQEQENEIIDWEETISRNGWTPSQSNLFSKAVKILHADRLARLATSGDRNEPILRRLSVNKSAQRFREILGSVMWDVRLTQWLHAILIENLSASYLVVYLDILQTLKSKVQCLIEKMMANHSQLPNKASMGSEALNLLLKRPWDPTISSFTQHKLRKLPGNPIMLLVPSGIQKQHTTARMQIWNKHLSSLGTLINLSASLSHLGTKLTSQSCLAQMITTTKGKLAEIRTEYPRRPIILIGWRAGASLACQVAVTEIVTAVVCLGFSANTVEGPRGEPDDSILDVQCPVLFVTGEHSASSRQEDLEEIREKMKVQTGLLVVGSADDCLRMGKTKKKLEKVTQSIVDRCILEEVGDFLAGVLTTPKPLLTSNELRRSTFARRRHNSTTSSVDSESSTAKRSRPGTPQSQMPSNSSLITKVNGNNLKTSTLRAATTRGRRSINVKKSIVMNSTFHSNQVNPSNGGITVNIGNLASLGPLGSLRLNPNASTLTATNVIHHSQSTSKINSKSVIEAAPPEDVMPFSRNSSESFQPGSQNLSKSSSRMAVNSESSTIGQPNLIYNTSSSPGPCLSVPSQTVVGEEKKSGSLKHVLTTTSKTGVVTQSNRGTTLQLIDKLQMNKPVIHNRSPTTSTVMNTQSMTRHQIRSVARNPIIIKTTPGTTHSKAASPANRGQKFSLTQNGGKLVTTTGANIILLESNGGQNRPVIVPFSSSSSKITPQSKTTPQKIQKSAQTTKSSPITKFSISKKIISSSSLLPQRPVLLRNKSASSALGTPGPATKSMRSDNAESVKSSPEDLLEIPVYYGEGIQGEIVSSNQQEDRPVVIPIIDSSKLKSAKKPPYPKDISYAEDGDSISFPLDCDIDNNTEEEGVKVLISSLNRVVKPPQIFITKSGSNVKVKKLKSFITDKAESEEAQDKEGKEEHVILGGGEEPKYFINYTEDNEGVLYEIMEDN